MRKKSIPYRRKREGKTNYKKRLKLLLSKKPRLVIRKSNKNISLQIVEYDQKGDRVIVCAQSGQLRKYGWKTCRSNIPSAYLTGLLLGKLATEKKIGEAVLDTGLDNSVKGSRLYAALKGATEAGLKIPCSEEVFPSPERLEGEHIAGYAKDLKQKEPEKFQRHNSVYLENQINPEDLPQYFEKTKEQIAKNGKEE